MKLLLLSLLLLTASCGGYDTDCFNGCNNDEVPADGKADSTSVPTPSGEPGLPGHTGAQGSPGVQGDAGPTGPAGTSGSEGRAGMDGEMGEQGPAGANGTPGASCHVIRIDRHHVKFYCDDGRPDVIVKG